MVVFNTYEVVPLREMGDNYEECEPRDADLWGLFGFDGDDAYAIGDFSNQSDAEFIKVAIENSIQR